MDDVVLVDAARTPIGRRNGILASTHAADLLGTVLEAVIDPCRHRLVAGAGAEVVGSAIGEVLERE